MASIKSAKKRILRSRSQALVNGNRLGRLRTYIKRVELAIAGGVSLMLCPDSEETTRRLGVASPDGRCFVFDARANGYVKGEGVGAVVLKPLAAARRDGDPVLAVIRGSAVGHGGHAQHDRW